MNKKIIIFALVFILLSSSLASASFWDLFDRITGRVTDSDTCSLRGDVNHNGELDSEDVSLVMDMYLGSVEVDTCGDMNSDGEITASDANLIQQQINQGSQGEQSCWKNGDCASNQFCEFDKCTAETGTCVDIPEICPTLYDPACGCDGKTYSNDCSRKIAKVSKAYEGECETTTCIDSDGGKNYYVRGSISVCYLTSEGSVSPESWETCTSPVYDACTQCTGACPTNDPECEVFCGAVKEYYCGEESIVAGTVTGAIQSETYICPNGCEDGSCISETKTCLKEGESYAVIPSAPECCSGLTAIGCEKPDNTGVCQDCEGAFYCTYCGNGICGTGENVCNCPEDCKTATTCIDSDGGKNYYVRGSVSICYPSQEGNYEGVTACTTPVVDACTQCTGLCPTNDPECEVFCGVVEEYYCGKDSTATGDYTEIIESETYTCLNGCKDGACIKSIKEKEPFCSATGTRSEGWYQYNKLIKYDTCNGCYVVCKFTGTNSEGWYSSCTDELVKSEKCEEVKSDCEKFGGYCATECKSGDGIIYFEGCSSGEVCCKLSEGVIIEECVGEGEKGNFIISQGVKCCPGLKQIANSHPDFIIGPDVTAGQPTEGLSFRCIAPTDGSFICSYCGDGTCGLGENECNCREDCEEVECAKENEMCGGIAGTRCCFGLTCELDGSYPDASGKCVKEIKPCDGCLDENNNCLPSTTRTSTQYCDIDKKLKNQLSGDVSCNNNFECQSNLCIDGRCTSLGLFQRFIKWFQKLFG